MRWTSADINCHLRRNYMAGELQKPAETCERYPIVGLRKFARSFRAAARLILAVPPATVFLAAGCGNPKAAPAIPSPEVEVASVVQKDVDLQRMGGLDGYINAQFSPRWQDTSSGKRTKKVGLCVRVRFSFKLIRVRSKRCSTKRKRSSAHAASTTWQNRNGCEPGYSTGQRTGDCAEPVGQRHSSEGSGQGNGQGSRSTRGANPAEPGIHRRKIAGRRHYRNAQVQIGNLVNPTTVLTTVSQVNPIKAYFSISEQEYIHYADQINAQTQKEIPSGAPPFDLILADGSIYPHKGAVLITNRQVDTTTGSIQIVCSFPNPKNTLRPGRLEDCGRRQK